jgi:glycosyltransferase involved in cell wall biosynthesis
MLKISVITIAYNSAETIEDTIVSVVNQDYAALEYIIVDGGSKDQTMDIVNRYRDRIAMVVSEKDEGIYDAMNKGIKMATGDVIGILNSDDFYAHAQVISRVAKQFQDKKCDALYADLVYVNREDTDKVIRSWEAGVYAPGKFLRGWMPPHPTFFLTKEKYNTFGLYNTALRSAADYELMLRYIHKHRVHLCYLPEVITKMRTGGQSNVTLRNRLKANLEDRAAWRINDLKPSWYTLTWKPISKVFQFLRRNK